MHRSFDDESSGVKILKPNDLVKRDWTQERYSWEQVVGFLREAESVVLL